MLSEKQELEIIEIKESIFWRIAQNNRFYYYFQPFKQIAVIYQQYRIPIYLAFLLLCLVLFLETTRFKINNYEAVYKNLLAQNEDKIKRVNALMQKKVTQANSISDIQASRSVIYQILSYFALNFADTVLFETFYYSDTTRKFSISGYCMDDIAFLKKIEQDSIIEISPGYSFILDDSHKGFKKKFKIEGTLINDSK